MALTHAIMTALLDEELTGYDLTKQFEVSLGFFWKASHQQIYRTLKDLDQQGLVALRAVKQSGKPDKKVYRLTESGHEALAEWLVDATPQRPVRDELFIKLYNLGSGHDAAIYSDIEHRLQLHEERLALYEKIRLRNYANPENLEGRRQGIYLSLLAGIYREEAGAKWCHEALGEIPKN